MGKPDFQLKSIKGVEIFSAGYWNGDPFTSNDLDEMVRAFDENKDHVRPFLKLGHDDEQKLLQKEGLPAAGWIDKIYRQGSKLFADFVDIPEKIFDLITKGAYKKVSSEIMLGVKILDKSYKYMVSAVALLGAETPGVMNLDDILARYGLESYGLRKSFATIEKSNTKVYEFSKEKKAMSKTEKEIELEAELKAKEEQLKAFSAKQDAADKELKAAQDKMKEHEAKVAEFSAKLAAQELDASVAKLEAEKLVTPAMKPLLFALLGAEKKEYSIKGADGKDKTASKFELVHELCKLFAAKEGVNLEDGSTDGKQKGSKVTEDEILVETEKYAADNKVTFAAAYKVVAKKYAEQLNQVPSIQEEA